MKPSGILTVVALTALSWITQAQTYTSCDPLTSSSCPADAALGTSFSSDFRSVTSSHFTASGSPTYSTDGVHFTVAKQGDAPQLISNFYIMFGKVSITMKAAPGAGIVSSLVLQSDVLDEIDMEWLGADSTQVQLNYFGKGDVTTYNRGTYAAAAANQANFITYTVEWTATQIIWSVAGKVVRVLTPATADADQYPQTPMQVKFGTWSGGDSANPAGTISWARGPTVYSNGPYSMIVQSISVQDYSTGTSYSYGDQSGNWTSIKSSGGKINANTPAASGVVNVASSSPTTALLIPAGIGGGTVTKTGWPWVATAVATSATATCSTSANVPTGWVVCGDGKVVPASGSGASDSYIVNVFLLSSSLMLAVLLARLSF